MSSLEKDPNLQEDQTIISQKEKRDQDFLDMMDKKQQEEKELQNQIVKKDKGKSMQFVNNEMNHAVASVGSKFLSALNWINHGVDYILANNGRIGLLSLFLTMALAFFIYGDTSVVTTKSIDYIYQVPVTVITSEGYELLDYDQTVTLQVVGDFSSIQWAKVMKEYKVVMDVSGKEEGEFDAYYRVEGMSNSIQVTVSPEYAHVNLSKVESRTFDLEFMFDNLSQADQGIVLKDPILHTTSVTLTAGKTKLNKISRVVAKIDASQITETAHNLEAPVVALDERDKEIEVSISPELVEFDIDVVSYSKTVPIKLDIIGEVDSNYLLKSITPSKTIVTIYGLEEDLAPITEVTAQVDISNTSSNVSINGVTIILPEKITKASERTISIDVVVEKKEQRVFENIPILLESLNANYIASIIGDSTITLRVSGPKAKIDALKAENLKVYVDLSNANVGTGKFDLLIANQDNTLTYEFENHTSIDVSITKNP